MADSSARMLRLLTLLQLHRHWPGADLADRLSVSERTIRRDVDRLRTLGYHVDSVPGATGGYQMAAGGTMPPTVFDRDEAVALAVGLRDVAHGTNPNTAEASLRALAKLTAILPGDVCQQIELVGDVTETTPFSHAASGPSPETLGAAAQACRDVVRLHFDYAAADGAHTRRYVEPYRLVTRGRRWYLVGFDLDRNDWRTFRIDRMAQLQPARNTFTPRPLPADDLAAYVGERIRALRPSYDIVIRINAPRDTVQHAFGRLAEVGQNHAGGSRYARRPTRSNGQWSSQQRSAHQYRSSPQSSSPTE